MTAADWWTVIIGAPLVAAAAGAFWMWAFDRRDIDHKIDAAWEAGYNEGWHRHELHTGTMVPDLASLHHSLPAMGRHAASDDWTHELPRVADRPEIKRQVIAAAVEPAPLTPLAQVKANHIARAMGLPAPYEPEPLTAVIRDKLGDVKAMLGLI